jgi:hypothetical protein
MRMDSGTVSGEGAQRLKDHHPTVLPIQPWQPSRIKTGLRNRVIGKKVSLLLSQREFQR